jgi:hypothetical protein
MELLWLDSNATVLDGSRAQDRLQSERSEANWVSISVVRPQCCETVRRNGVEARGVPCGDLCRSSCHLR